MITIPQSTIEKPLTAIDYIAALAYCASSDEVSTFTEQMPPEVRHDERYCKAVQQHLARLWKAA